MEDKTRKFKIEIIADIECKTISEGLEKAEKLYPMFNVISVKPYHTLRSNAQNRALHKWFTELEEECTARGITMDMIITKPQDIPITRHLLKDLFRFIGHKMFKINSTAKLDKAQFDKVQQTFEKGLGQNAELYIPFPSEERMMDEDLSKY